MKTEGVCKLTGEFGRFVDSHLLPKALTRAGRTKGEKFIENGPAVVRQTNVSSSWYDTELVIRSGEDILERYDDWGIRELRRAGLVWSSPSHSHLVPYGASEAPYVGTARVRINHPKRLRLFCLSLLWRAAASSLPAFDKIRLDSAELEFLRRLLLWESVDDFGNFPIILWSLLGPGAQHNHTPIFQRSGELGAELPVDYYRFYIDGLLVLFGGAEPTEPFWKAQSTYLVHETPELDVLTQPFEYSRQRRDLYDVFLGTEWRAA
jgi:hypothetical protein